MHFVRECSKDFDLDKPPRFLRNFTHYENNNSIIFRITRVPLSLRLPDATAASESVPPPDGGYPNFTTAEGQNALQSLTTGAANTAVGWYSLFSDTTGSFNTATGAGSLLFNTADA